MLEILRKYQKILFFVVTVMVIFSFIFFGTYNTFARGSEERSDVAIGKLINGSSMMRSEVQKLSRFIATDRQDLMQGRGLPPNFCNDGLIRHDFLKTGLAQLLVSEYFEPLKSDLESRLDKAKRYRPYAHPEAPFLSAKTVWDHFLPQLNVEIAALQAESEANFTVYSRLERLYQYQNKLHPEMLRQILMYQSKQYSWLNPDPRLSYDDMSLFGFHSAADWFGRNFVDLIAEFVLNAAAVAEEKGYTVSLQEAKGDLIHIFQETVDKMKEAKADPNMSFHSHLQMIGFDEGAASEVWRKVLLFRRYFEDVGDAAFIDKLPYKDFAGYAKESAVIESYRFPITIHSSQDLAEFQFYVKAIGKEIKEGLPTAILPLQEVEKKVPDLVQKTVKAKVAEIAKKQVALRATLKEVWEWEITNWGLLVKEFSLPQKETKEEKFAILNASEKRDQIDAWAREKIVDANPIWIEEALAVAPLAEKSWTVQGSKEPVLKKEGFFYRIEELEIVKEKHILTFNEAKEVLSTLVAKVEGELDSEKNPLTKFSKEALSSLKNNPKDPRWVQSGVDPLIDQFKLEKRTETIARTSKEDWMKEQAFLMLPELWSPIHVEGNGEVVFFYLQEKKSQPAPILDQLNLGKEMLAADAKLYVTEKLLKVLKQKNAIVIPAQKEDE